MINPLAKYSFPLIFHVLWTKINRVDMLMPLTSILPRRGEHFFGQGDRLGAVSTLHECKRRAFSPAFRPGCQVRCNDAGAEEYRLACPTPDLLCTKAEGLVFNFSNLGLFSRGAASAQSSRA